MDQLNLSPESGQSGMMVMRVCRNKDYNSWGHKTKYQQQQGGLEVDPNLSILCVYIFHIWMCVWRGEGGLEVLQHWPMSPTLIIYWLHIWIIDCGEIYQDFLKI